MTALEIIRFRLKSDVSDKEFLDSVEPTTSFLKAQPGYIRRRIVADAAGDWTDVIEWESLEQAKAASAQFSVEKHPSLADYMNALDTENLAMSLEQAKLTDS